LRLPALYKDRIHLVTVLLIVRLELPEVRSLKGKRRILKSLFAKLRNDFNISIAEVDDNDILRSATVGAAIVSNSNRFGQQVTGKIVNRIESLHDVILLDYSTESF